VCTVIWLVVVSGAAAAYAKYGASRSDPTSIWYTFPNWIQPNKKWHDWAGYPEAFSNIAGYIPTVTEKTKQNAYQKSKTKDTDCMLACAGEEDCVGFLFDKGANVCTLYSSLNNLMPSTSSNVVYSVKDKEPTTMYVQNVGKQPPAPTSVNITSAFTMGLSDIAIASISGNGTTTTVTTTTPHGLTTTSPITIYNTNIVFSSGGSPTIFSVSSTGLTIPSTTTFTFPSIYSGAVTYAAGSATLPGLINISATPTTGATTIQFTTGTNHGFTAGQTVGVNAMTATTATLFNNVFTISSVPSPLVFNVTISGTTPGQRATGGNVTLTSSLQKMTTTDATGCAVACSSNTSCLAFLFSTAATGSGPNCAQLTNPITGDLITASSVDTYTTSVPKFIDSSQYY
jgi:hypothetical protein